MAVQTQMGFERLVDAERELKKKEREKSGSVSAPASSSHSTPPPPPPPQPTPLLPPHPSPYHHSIRFPTGLKKDVDGKLSFLYAMVDFPVLPQLETKEDVDADFKLTMDRLNLHARMVKETREKWNELGEMNPARQEFLLSAETYVIGHRDIAKDVFRARYQQCIEKGAFSECARKAPPLLEGFTFSERYSRDLLKHPEIHQLFNPVDTTPPPPPPPKSTPAPPPVEAMDVTPTETSESSPQADAGGIKEGAAAKSGGGQQQQQRQRPNRQRRWGKTRGGGETSTGTDSPQSTDPPAQSQV